MSAFQSQAEARLLSAFRRAAAEMPWYRTLLDEHGVRADQIVDLDSFSRRCPALSKRNTFDRFPLDQLAATTAIAGMATVLTSSGHGGRFSFGLSTRGQAAASASFSDDALDAAFQIKSRSTLAINCLPMGVGFSSQCMTVATTSVREDMAVALVEAFGAYYDQILLVADPLFMKRLTDFAAAQATNWGRFPVHVVLGEEIFGEHFRGYVSTCLGLKVDRPEHGYIISSFGVGELGLHLCYETPATIALRRAAWTNPAFARDLLGVENAGSAVPMILGFNPLRTFIEVTQPDADGYGQMTVSMLDAELPLPLLRYQTGDVARLLDADSATAALRCNGLAIPRELPPQLLALKGRLKETLPDGSHVGVYKDALYADHEIARHLTGAFRLIASGTTCTMHVQLTASHPLTGDLEWRILQAIPAEVRPARLVLWPYDHFPFGMTVDYERKFSYYVPGERESQGRPILQLLA
jgi:phenylacetate-CoA ligase